jgi:predicted PurR-regulated permease PerM
MPAESKTELSFASRVLTTAVIVVLAILLILLLYFTFDVLLLFFGAALIAIFLRGLSSELGIFLKIGDGARVMLVALLLLLITAGAIALLAPSVAEQVKNLRDDLPRSARAVGDYLSQFGWGRALIEQLPSVDDVRSHVDTSTVATRVGGIFSSTAGAIANFFVLVLLAIYLAAEPEFYIKGFLKLFPIRRRERVREIVDKIGQSLQWWLVGKAASMLFIGILTWIGLMVLGVPLALTLGLLAGLLSFIPNFGPIISAVPALLLAFIDSPITAVYVLILFVVVQLIESNIVTPFIERTTIELPPALTIIFQLVMSVLVGGMGLVLATPLLAAIMVIVQLVYIEDALGDRNVEVERKTD